MNSAHTIKQYRERHGLSQEAMAKQIGVTQGIVWRWEKGLAEITADRAVIIEEKIGGELPAEALSTTIQKYEELKSKRNTARKGRKHATA
jgi:transcriptional regulator with XRE-family HTH domain